SPRSSSSLTSRDMGDTGKDIRRGRGFQNSPRKHKDTEDDRKGAMIAIGTGKSCEAESRPSFRGSSSHSFVKNANERGTRGNFQLPIGLCVLISRCRRC